MDEATEQEQFDGIERRIAAADHIDRRRHQRYAVDAWAEVMVKDATLLFRGRVLDVSTAGCFVATEARLRLAPGTLVEIIFRVEDRILRCEATVRIVRFNGAGFLFDAMDARARLLLDALIAELESPTT